MTERAETSPEIASNSISKLPISDSVLPSGQTSVVLPIVCVTVMVPPKMASNLLFNSFAVAVTGSEKERPSNSKAKVSLSAMFNRAREHLNV